MKLTDHSKAKIRNSAVEWSVPRDYFDPIYNYLVYGMYPGSFFEALLANDMFAAMQHSHPSNSVISLKDLTSWVSNRLPRSCWGDRASVDAWCSLDEADRRAALEKSHLIYTEEQEIMLALRGVEAKFPIFDLF